MYYNKWLLEISVEFEQKNNKQHWISYFQIAHKY